MEQLKLCPFCGCDAEVRTGYAAKKHDETKEVPIYVYVRCNRCFCQTMEFMTRNNKNAYGDAIEAWNRRSEGAIKALEQEPKTGHWILADEQNKEDVENG